MKIKEVILSIAWVKNVIEMFVRLYNRIELYITTSKAISTFQSYHTKVIYYFGKPVHSNLGDLAQYICIRNWLKKNYEKATVLEIETDAIVNTPFSVIKKIRCAFKAGDFIVFQSGYTTTDLGGFADEMHCSVMSTLPDAPMLMMPQTIFFKNEDRKQRTSEIYNSMKHMLFLARDNISYEMAKGMFPDIPVEVFPDIVTTLIGSKAFSEERNGILFCCRDDGEKYYGDDEIRQLMTRCSALASVNITDTTKHGKTRDIVADAERYINAEIEEYAKYKLIITDRFHGTILSLVAGTPVVIIKTTDHKVTMGAEWFKGVYDDYVYLAQDLDDAYTLAEEVLQKKLDYKLEPYFEKEYYDKLTGLFENIK